MEWNSMVPKYTIQKRQTLEYQIPELIQQYSLKSFDDARVDVRYAGL